MPRRSALPLLCLVVLVGACGLRESQAPAGPVPVEQIVEALGSHEARPWDAAVAILSERARRGEVEVFELTALLEDESARRIQGAAEVLGRLGEDAAEAMPALADVVRECGGPEGASAAWALGRMGEAGLIQLTDLLASGDPEAYPIAAHALGLVGPGLRDVVYRVVEVLHHESWDVRWAAMRVLETAGPVAVPELLQIARSDGDPIERAAWELVVNAGEAALPHLVDTLHPGAEERACLAVRALTATGAAALPYVPLLADVLGWAGEELGTEIVRALLALEDAAKEHATGAAIWNALTSPKGGRVLIALLADYREDKDLRLRVLDLIEECPDILREAGPVLEDLAEVPGGTAVERVRRTLEDER